MCDRRWEDPDNPPYDPCPVNEDETTTNQKLINCFTPMRSGMATGWCLEMDETMDIAWEFEPIINCEASNQGFVPEKDRLVLDVVPPNGISAWFRPAADLHARDNWVAGPGESFPLDAIRDKGEPVRIIEERPVRLPITLERAPGEFVAWQVDKHPQFGGGRFAAVGFEALEGPEPEVELTSDGSVIITAAAGARAKLWLETEVADFELGIVEGVARNDIESIELVVGYAPPDEDVPVSPAGARAILRDGGGEPVYGGLIEWEVLEGRLGINRTPLGIDGQPDLDAPDCEYVALAGDCYDNPLRDNDVKAVLAARWGDLEDIEEMEWIIVPGESESFWNQFAGLFGGSSGGEQRDTTYPCEGPGAVTSCECSADGRATHPPWALALGLLVLLRRPRSRR